jgi:hypothetical protein
MDTQNVSIINAQILESLENDDTNLFEKKAQASATNYTRIQIREDSFAFKILPPEKATDDMLRYDLTEDLAVVWEREPDSPAARWVPLQTVPEGEYIKSSRYIIPFARILTPNFKKDIAELRTTKQDIRKILTDNSIKDGLAEIDSKFIKTVNSIVFDSDGPGLDNHVSGKCQWQDFEEPLNRDTFAEATKMLPSGNKDGKFVTRNYCALMNEITARDLLKLERNEIGGDKAQDFFLNGLTTDTIMGIKTLFTIKNHLVPTNWVYFFAEPDFLGKCFYMDDWTMYVKKEAYFISMFSYWMGGFAFGNTAGMALARFNVAKTANDSNDSNV